MVDPAFRIWLDVRYPQNVASSRFSNVQRLARFYGDLDQHFFDDGLASVLSDLEYSADDEVAGRHNPTPIEFEPEANLRNGLATLKAALRLYVEFRSSDPT